MDKTDDTFKEALANGPMPFVVFEGIDGSGKTTLIKKIAERLKIRGQVYHLTREPGGTVLGEEIRGLLLRTSGATPLPRTELLLYEAIRAQHVDEVIKPALKEKKWVLCDRFAASSVAFQAGGRKIARENIDWLNRFATDGLQADLTVLLDLSVEESEKRRLHRVQSSGIEQDRFEQEKRDFHHAVRQSYLEQAQADPKSWLVLDATQTADQIFMDFLAEMEKKNWLGY